MNSKLSKYIDICKKYVIDCYRNCLREPSGRLKYKFVVPGSAYENQLWDWDSWLTSQALMSADKDAVFHYVVGSVLNFLDSQDEDGRIPICVSATTSAMFDLHKGVDTNICKPCLAQFALDICSQYDDISWLGVENLAKLEKFVDYYLANFTHNETGLLVWKDDFAVGVDNDPCVFFRPQNSCASVLLNCLMHNELASLAILEYKFGREQIARKYIEKSIELKLAIDSELYDQRDGLYYSADVNLRPIDPTQALHSGCPRHWNSLPMRIGVWSGFLAMWCGIATKTQADKVVKLHFDNKQTFRAEYGVRSLSKLEKMYQIVESSNPSCWQGPVWINANYFVFQGLLNYGYKRRAKRLAENIVTMLGKDIESCGQMHEYYDGATGKGISFCGFQSWNLLCYNLATWLENN